MLFGTNVEEAVAESLQGDKVLVVYCKAGDGEGTDPWLDQWFKKDSDVSILKGKAVWLEVVRGSAEFDNFTQIFPDVVVPSVRLIKQGKVVLVIKGDDNTHEVSHWKKLMIGLGIKDENAITEHKISDKPRESPPRKTERDKIVEKATTVHQQEYLKQLKQAEEERLRILTLVRADKAERLARKHSHEVEAGHELPMDVRDNIIDKSRFNTGKCVLMFRLTDSKNLKHTFDSQETLNDVRKWVDVNRTDGAGPYSFHRNIPRVTFTESDELKTLEDLDLAPRSVLLLKALDSGNKHLNVTDEQDSGLINKMFTGFSQWWGGSHSASPPTTEQLYEQEEHISRQHEEHFNRQHEDHFNRQHEDRLNRQYSNINHESAASSHYSTPIMAPRVTKLAKEPSEMNLASRPVSPNIVKFVNRDDEEKDNDPEEKATYNGNNVKLEKNRDPKD
ncbi:UBX domain-containing protein 7 [Nakaseomyces bracarensis]|uniref:UBX domain-containing protein 7 n=1 Tax=Nakaseomyces bracarensis TaxID=273131 RepID=A0ABR4NZU0_9SACH